MKGQKKVPVRRCVGCNERKEKKELVRVIRTPDGSIETDISGKANGRGAYICRGGMDCLRKARRNHSLERSLGMSIPAEVYDRLEEELGNTGGTA